MLPLKTLDNVHGNIFMSFDILQHLCTWFKFGAIWQVY